MGKENKHIVSFSGGKDSTAMLLLLLEQNKPIDEVVFFDTGSWEFPEMTNHINRVEKYTGVKIVRLHPRKSFDDLFENYILTKGKRKGKKGYGFPQFNMRWCTGEKKDVLNMFLTKQGKDRINHIGFNADEKHRAEKSKSKVNFPLIDNNITGELALKMCYNYGFDWDGLYEHFNRVSCWCCPLKSIRELKTIHNNYPALWERLIKMQNKSWNKFKPEYSVFDLTKRFESENLQLSLFHNGFEKAKAGGAILNYGQVSSNFKSENECSTCS